MPAVWNDGLLVNSGEMDRQHRELVGLTGALQAAIAAGEPLQMLQRRCARLAEFAANHFTTEEGLMLASGYPHYHEHRLDHERLMSQFDRIRENLVSGADSDLLLTVITNWTVSHICYSDRQLADYLSRVRSE